MKKLISLVIPGVANWNQGGLMLQKATVERENFDRWLYDSKGPATPREKLIERLNAWVEVAAREDRLDDPQVARLRLAGKGDIERFLEQVELKRREFETQRTTFKEGFQALRNLGPLSKRYKNGPFEGGSMFAKTLCKIQSEKGLPPHLPTVPPAGSSEPSRNPAGRATGRVGAKQGAPLRAFTGR
ncbi:hypothetical protein [Aquisphaera insulae]|uniref:hypothetical protein n=1 Tax=Aquisphaera insulae TaxID=2712864 RepID=UPI0013EA3811|nr:hypothetical protein [Aquisphaera insulae]